MAQTFVQLPDDSANIGKKEDHFATSGTGQLRESVVIADPSTDAAAAKVQNSAPGSSDYGLTVRDPATAALTLQVFDLDTGAGTAATVGFAILGPASGGPVVLGTTTNPLNVNTQGSMTPDAPSATSVGVTDGLALAASAGRKRVELVNTSSNFISISYGANAAVLNSGWTLTPYGTMVISNPAVAALAIRAIASGTSSNLGIQTFA